MQPRDDPAWHEPDPARLRAALRLLNAIVKPGASVADLGCLYGAYTLAFARAGSRSVGIEARQDSVWQCWKAADEAGLTDEVDFVCDDVRNVERYGPYDAVFCCGVLYHMDKPAELLNAIGKITRRLLILHTHYSMEGDRPIRYKLSPATKPESAGHWYKEGELDHPLSAWGNSQSFWLTKDALIEAVQDAGFDLVLQIHDHQADILGDPGRIMLAAVRKT